MFFEIIHFQIIDIKKIQLTFSREPGGILNYSRLMGNVSLQFKYLHTSYGLTCKLAYMKILQIIIITLLMSCAREKKGDTINREIKLKEARKGHEVVHLTISHEKTVEDTSAVYYNAVVKIKSKDSTIVDSIFLIKSSDGVLLPFSTKIP